MARWFDWWLLGAIATLLSLSVVMMYSTVGLSLMTKQFLIVIVALVVMLLVTRVDYHFFQNYAYFFYIGGIILLIAVRLFGSKINGTTGWFEIAGFGFQPVELCKMFLIMALARFYADHTFSFNRWRTIALTLSLVALYAFLVLLQPDLGSTAVFIGVSGVMLILTNIRWKQLAILVGVAAVALIITWFGYLNTTQKNRIFVFLDPALDPFKSGYNVTQAIVSVGSGQWFGRGLGLGTQSQLQFLPERQTDFIFAVIAEELGFVGAVSVLLLLGIICWRLWRMLQAAHNPYAAYVIAGTLTLICIHTVVNVGMNIGVMPVTGIPLPFVSAGGSSLLSLAFILGTIQNYYRQSQH